MRLEPFQNPLKNRPFFVGNRYRVRSVSLKRGQFLNDTNSILIAHIPVAIRSERRPDIGVSQVETDCPFLFLGQSGFAQNVHDEVSERVGVEIREIGTLASLLENLSRSVRLTPKRIADKLFAILILFTR